MSPPTPFYLGEQSLSARVISHSLILFTLTLHQFLGLKEALQMLHLPNTSDDEDDRLSNGPPENTLVGALTRHAKALLTILQKKTSTFKSLQWLQLQYFWHKTELFWFFLFFVFLTHPLVVLLLLDLFDLVQQLSDS